MANNNDDDLTPPTAAETVQQNLAQAAPAVVGTLGTDINERLSKLTAAVQKHNLPNLPDDNRRFDPKDVLRARAHIDEDADWRCRGCGIRGDATEYRVCPRCGETVHDYDPQDDDH